MQGMRKDFSSPTKRRTGAYQLINLRGSLLCCVGAANMPVSSLYLVGLVILLVLEFQ
jgi:hypothetical protein